MSACKTSAAPLPLTKDSQLGVERLAQMASLGRRPLRRVPALDLRDRRAEPDRQHREPGRPRREGAAASAAPVGPPGFTCPDSMICRPKPTKPSGWNVGLLHHLHSGEQFGPSARSSRSSRACRCSSSPSPGCGCTFRCGAAGSPGPSRARPSAGAASSGERG